MKSLNKHIVTVLFAVAAGLNVAFANNREVDSVEAHRAIVDLNKRTYLNLASEDSALVYAMCDSLKYYGNIVNDLATYYFAVINYDIAHLRLERAKRNIARMRTDIPKTNRVALYIIWMSYVETVAEERSLYEALEECQQMEDDAKANDEERGVAYAYIARSIVDDDAYAMDNFNKAIEIINAHGDSALSHDIYRYMGYYCAQKHDWANAEHAARKTLELSNLQPYEQCGAELQLLQCAVNTNKQALADSLFVKLNTEYRAGRCDGWVIPQWGMVAVEYLCKYGNPHHVPEYIDLIPSEERENYLTARELYYVAIDRCDKAALYADSLLSELETKLTLTESERVDYVHHRQNVELEMDKEELANAKLITENQRLVAIIIALGAVLLFVVYIIFAIRRHNRLLMKERDRAVRLDKMKMKFINNLSHEVRMPLNVFLGLNKLLNNNDVDVSPDERAELVEGINSQSNILLKLLDDVVRLSRIDDNKIEPQMCAANVADIVSEAIDKVKDRMHDGVEMDAQKVLASKEQLTTDPALLGRALVCVLENAAKFTTVGYIRVRYDGDAFGPIEPKGHPVACARITVSDTGDGIPADQAEAIFERFEKIGRFDSGFGLGLSIARELLALIGASIHLDTTYIEGSSFVITLPK